MTDSLKAEDLIKELFEKTLLVPSEYDQDVVQIVKEHLALYPIPTKAGEKISAELEILVKKRVATKKTNGDK
jgi:hypothetical protein